VRPSPTNGAMPHSGGDHEQELLARIKGQKQPLADDPDYETLTHHAVREIEMRGHEVNNNGNPFPWIIKGPPFTSIRKSSK